MTRGRRDYLLRREGFSRLSSRQLLLAHSVEDQFLTFPVGFWMAWQETRVLPNRTAPIVLGADQPHKLTESDHSHIISTAQATGSAAILILMMNCSYVSC